MKQLIILNDSPYGSERSYNGMRLAKALRAANIDVTVFLIADAVACAKAGQEVPDGYYNMERMIESIVRSGVVLLCGTCMDARGISQGEIVKGARRSDMKELAETTVSANQVMVF